jgi:DNA invertase Pin-like site-specific DNA recombinase
VLAAARKGEVCALLVTRFDRVGRSAIDVQVNVSTIVNADCEFITTEQGLHLRPGGDAMSRAQMGMMAISSADNPSPTT